MVKHDTNPAVQAEWKNYFAAMRAGNVAEMTRIYGRIETLQIAERSRKTTRRMAAVTVATVDRLTGAGGQ